VKHHNSGGALMHNLYNGRVGALAGATRPFRCGRQLDHRARAAGHLLRRGIRPEARLNGFELKPQGACLGELCYPLPEGLLVEQDGESWFDLAAFADHIGQPCVADPEAGAWSFAEIPAKRERLLTDAMAPDFEITDRTGKVIRRADLKGKKALIVTWSSW
jgi:hypothetical protein